MSDATKKRGRPPLSPEQKLKRESYKKAHKTGISSTKEGGYASQKKYREAHPDRIKEQRKKQQKKWYEPKIRIPIENKEIFDEFLMANQITITDACLQSIYSVYGIDFRIPIDKTGDS